VRSGSYLASGYGQIYTKDPQIYIHTKQDILMFHLYANKIEVQILVTLGGKNSMFWIH